MCQPRTHNENSAGDTRGKKSCGVTMTLQSPLGSRQRNHMQLCLWREKFSPRPPNRLPLMVSAQSCVTSPPPPPTAGTSFGKKTRIPALGLDQSWFRITLYNQRSRSKDNCWEGDPMPTTKGTRASPDATKLLPKRHERICAAGEAVCKNGLCSLPSCVCASRRVSLPSCIERGRLQPLRVGRSYHGRWRAGRPGHLLPHGGC